MCNAVMLPAKGSPIPVIDAVVENLEPRRLLAAAMPGLLDPLLVPKFVNPMPNALEEFTFQPTVVGNTQFYDLGIYPIEQDLGLGLIDAVTRRPVKTRLYGYGTSAATASYPGRTIVAQSGTQVRVTWRNELWDTNHDPPRPLTLDQFVVRTFDSAGNNVSAVDYSLFNPEAMPRLGIPTVTHLHGGHTESASDGLPQQWYTPPLDSQGNPREVGPDYVKRTFTYDNDQPAATLWYHDHSMGITRLHAYAGLAGFYLIRDAYDTGDASNAWGLPWGAYELPIAIQDKMFTASGELFYPTMRAVNPDTGQSIDPSTMPEMFGDTILVNGKAWPYYNVEPRKYRLRLLNASDSRFYNLSLATSKGVLPIIQIGSEQGMLNAPVSLTSLLIAPGQRADVIVDFAPAAGQSIIMRNTAKTPFPKGAATDPQTTGQILQFRVGTTVSAPDNPLPATLRGGPGQPPMITPLTPSTDPLTGVAKIRKLGLFEVEDEYLRITPMLGTVGGRDDGPIGFMEPVTETPLLNDTEIWEVYNTTPDAHPIHLHLVRFQVLSRQKFSFSLDPITGGIVPGSIRLVGRPRAPYINEGWQDTVQMMPGEVTRIVATFDRPGAYVWHCHILAHEEHDMMRPFQVVEPEANRAWQLLNSLQSSAVDRTDWLAGSASVRGGDSSWPWAARLIDEQIAAML